MKKIAAKKTLREQLAQVEVGESVRISCKEYTPINVKVTLSRMRADGFVFKFCSTLSSRTMQVTRIY